jgi:hypothetical protein
MIPAAAFVVGRPSGFADEAAFWWYPISFHLG